MDRIRRIVVAGGSLAGYSAVSELLDLDYSGEILWVTSEKRAAYSRPALSKEFMQGRLDIADIALPEIASGRSNLQVLRGRTCTALSASDRSVQLDQGELIDFDGVLICTGAAARMPAVADGIGGVLSLRTLEDALAIKSELSAKPRIAILGGGLIGCELAASMRALGLHVTLIEQMNSLLGRAFGAALGDYFRDLHGQHGVRVVTGATVVELVARNGRVTEARLSDGTMVAADLILVGAGSQPVTQWLEGSGLELSDGVVCDANLATSHPGIYAAGDVARWFNPLYGTHMRVEHWSSAAAQGRAAARNLLASGDAAARESVPFAEVPYFWSDQYGLKIQMVGWHQDHDHIAVENLGSPPHPVTTFFKKGRLVAAAGVNASRTLMGFRKQIELEAKSDRNRSSGAISPPQGLRRQPA